MFEDIIVKTTLIHHSKDSVFHRIPATIENLYWGVISDYDKLE